MSNQLEHLGSGSVTPSRRLERQDAREGYLLERTVRRQLARLEANTLVQVANVQAEGYVRTAKIHEVTACTAAAMTDHAQLADRANILAAGDPILADELRFYRDAARLGHGHLLASFVETLSRSV